MRSRVTLTALLSLLLACGSSGSPAANDAGDALDTGRADADATGDARDDAPPPGDASDAAESGAPSPFADSIVSFTPGPNAGFGEDKLPGVVLGPPQGEGAGAGSLDVLSLGERGCIVLHLGVVAIDGPGTDLLVFENPFGTFYETGIVSVSADGVTWSEFPCASTDKANTYPGCAGTHYVYANPANGLDPTDPAVAGGDPYDLHDLGVTAARFVRVCDSGMNAPYAGISGGFDLDAVAVVHAKPTAP
jgi:hypothetical protein